MKLWVAVLSSLLVWSFNTHASEWLAPIPSALKSYQVEQIATDVLHISDKDGKLDALLIDTSVWLTSSDLVLKADADSISEWNEFYSFSMRSHDKKSDRAKASSRRILADGKIDYVFTEKYVIASDHRSYALIAITLMRDEERALQLRDKLDALIARQSGNRSVSLNEIFNVLIAEAHAQEVRRTEKGGNPQISSSSENLPDPRCKDSGYPEKFQRRVNEKYVPFTAFDIASLPCAKGVSEVLWDQITAVPTMAASILPLVAIISNPLNLMNSSIRRQAISGTTASAQESAEMGRRFASWVRNNRGQYIQAMTKALGQDWCLSHAKRVEYACKALTVVVEVGFGGVAGARLATLSKAMRVGKSIRAVAAIPTQALSRTVGKRFILYDAKGVRQPLDSIKSGESFQVVMMPERNQVAMIRGGIRNGGHQQITRLATQNLKYQRFEPSDMQASGNIRFHVVDGKWRTEVGGRYYTSEHPIAARELGEFAKDSGVPPTLVTPNRLPGWEK